MSTLLMLIEETSGALRGFKRNLNHWAYTLPAGDRAATQAALDEIDVMRVRLDILHDLATVELENTK